MRNLLRIGRVALPYAFPFHEHQGLHQQVTGTCLTLDVIYRLSLFDVRIETKNGHRPRANFSYNIMRLCSSIMAILAVMAILAIGDCDSVSLGSSRLDTLAKGQLHSNV